MIVKTQTMPVTLLENQIGASYEGQVWNRFLQVQLNDETLLEVFDASNLTHQLQPFIFCSMVLNPTFFENLRWLEVETATWQGRVDFVGYLSEVLPNSPSPDLEVTLVQLPQGTVVLATQEILAETGRKPIVGYRLGWDNARWELLAVL